MVNFKHFLNSYLRFAVCVSANNRNNDRISFHLVKMDQVTAEINFIKVALGSFEDYTDENERKAYLKSELSSIGDELLKKPLKGYVGMAKDGLEQQLDRLEQQLHELQKKENLLQEEKNKQLGSSAAGNRCFVIV
jgi:hypothetical protein